MNPRCSPTGQGQKQDERLRRGPEGWRHRLALIEAAELGWFAGDRVSPDRLALWMSMRLAGVQDDTGALARVGWAVRRLTGGPGPEAGFADFLDRSDPENIAEDADRFADRSGRSEAKAAVFAPLAMGGAAGLRAGGPPSDRLSRWLDGMDSATLTAMRHLDDIEAWSERAGSVMATLSGRTPPALRAVLTEWPLVSAPMAETLTGASRAAAQRNLAWMEERGLIREVTGQGRFRMWRMTT